MWASTLESVVGIVQLASKSDCSSNNKQENALMLNWLSIFSYSKAQYYIMRVDLPELKYHHTNARLAFRQPFGTNQHKSQSMAVSLIFKSFQFTWLISLDYWDDHTCLDCLRWQPETDLLATQRQDPKFSLKHVKITVGGGGGGINLSSVCVTYIQNFIVL